MDFPRIKVVNVDTGDEFAAWESCEINSQFLAACSSFTLDAASEKSAIDLARSLAADAKVRLFVDDGEMVLTGYVDECKLSVSRSGYKVHVTGRDVLGPVVDGNVDPRMQVPKEATLLDLAKLVLTDQFKLLVDFEEAALPPEKQSKVGAPPAWNKSKHKRKTPIKDAKPKDNEGGMAYLSRIFMHHGYWLWASVGGGYIHIAGPEYDQTPLNDITLVPGSSRTNVISATSTTSTRDVPSHVLVRGSDSGRGQKSAVKGMATFPYARRFKPVYMGDSNATTTEKAERIAAQFLAKKQKDFFHYECSVVGHAGNGGVWAVNTIANIKDDVLGVSGPMWIESVSFRQSRGSGTTTDLKLIPLNTLLFDIPDGSSAPAFEPYKNIVITESSAPVLSQQFTADAVSFNAKLCKSSTYSRARSALTRVTAGRRFLRSRCAALARMRARIRTKLISGQPMGSPTVQRHQTRKAQRRSSPIS